MEKIKCEICGAECHAIQIHLRDSHPEMTVAEYAKTYPEAPLMSEFTKKRLAEKQAEKAKAEAAAAAAAATSAPHDERPAEAGVGVVAETGQAESPAIPSIAVPTDVIVKRPLHEVFNLGKVKIALSSSGHAIPITTISNARSSELVPSVSDDYVYDVDELKNVILALELGINPYVWGHKGSGKSELFEQIAARTGRPFFRVQHTAGTEESHVVGQWVVRNGQTEFELGPLPLAMKNGWMYLADEYDFAIPAVLSVYQAVLEGKPLVIKEADAANRIIKPHPNFRFVATGNTNGSGDETGLYQGTNLQNSANYDRFGMVLYKDYMKKVDEVKILMKRAGLVKEDAEKLVEFAGMVRDAYKGAKISDTVSPRALINAGRLGVMRASFRQGVTLAFINKLTSVDREVVDGLAQRVLGS